MMRRLPAYLLLLVFALCGTAALAQDVGDGVPDPSGVWMGQLTATGPNAGWFVTMTIAVRGNEARGVFEWLNLGDSGQTFTAFAGSWDAADARAIVVEKRLSEEPGAEATDVGKYTIQFPMDQPDTAWCTYQSESDDTRGAGYFSRVKALAEASGFAGRWQSLPALTNPAMNLFITASADGFKAAGAALDREQRVIRPMKVFVQQVPGQPGRCSTDISLGGESSAATHYDGAIDESGCLLRLSKNGQSAVLLVRRSAALPEGQSTAPPPEAEGSWSGRCIGVSDGDTISVMHDGVRVRIRLNGVDSPEKNQAFASVAKRFTSAAVFGKTVKVFPTDTDQYGRTVADVQLPDATSLNESLVAAGLAWWYVRYAPDNTRLQALQAQARQARRGLWADANPIPPWEFRRQRRGGY